MVLGTIQILLAISLCEIVKAALVWNTGGEAALFISIAVPIDMAKRRVFMSYNFEASYRLPKTWKKIPKSRPGKETQLGPHNDLLDDSEDYYDDYEDHQQKRKKPKTKPSKHKKPKPSKSKHKKKIKQKTKLKQADHDYKDFFEGYPDDDAKARYRRDNSLLSRSKFYEILSQRFEQHGFGSGDNCLLQLICEANSVQLGEINGVLGSIMHVMLSPSSSQYEALPQRYYKAESNGQQDNCETYHAKCGRSLLELITRPLTHYIYG